jgi:hypothetical protein
MSTESVSPPAVLSVEKPTTSKTTKAWIEVEKEVQALKMPKGTPARKYNPPFTDESACAVLVSEVIVDYKKVRFTPPRPTTLR